MFRFSHVITVLALILLSGVVSVRRLEQASGGANVPGLVLLDAPWMGPAEMERLQRHWSDGRIEQVPAEAGILAPFDPALLGRLVARGDAAQLYTLDPAVPASLGRVMGWPSVLDEIAPSGRESPTVAMAREAARFVRTRTDPRAFVLGLLCEPTPGADMVEVLYPLVEAAVRQPWFRRSSIVVLGDTVPGIVSDATPERWGWRLDLGRWVDRARPRLADLLDTRW